MVIAFAILFGLAAFAQKPFEQGGQWGYRNASGKVVIEPRYTMADPFSAQGIAAVVDSQGWAYIDRQGKVVIRPHVVDNGPDEFAGGLARFVANDQFGFFDKRGRIVIPARFTFAAPFSDGRAAVCEGCRIVAEGEHKSVRGGRWGFIAKSGILAIPLLYEAAEPFERGKARVKLGGAWKRIDLQGKIEPSR